MIAQARGKARPVMRYHGGKWILAPWIISHFPPHRVYVEPFGGAASVLMRKPRSYAEVYNDIDGEIVNVFQVLRDPKMSQRLIEMVRLTPFARDEFKLSYSKTDDLVEQARRTIARTFMGFGSSAQNATVATGFRANSNRSGTTPAHDWANYPDAMRTMVERLRGVVIENRPADEIITQHDGPQTLHYIDPPYVLATRSNRQRYLHEMADEDHRALAKVLHGLEGMVIVSGYACDLYDELYWGWRRVTRASYADGAQPRTEVLWLSPRPALMELPLFAERGE